MKRDLLAAPGEQRTAVLSTRLLALAQRFPALTGLLLLLLLLLIFFGKMAFSNLILARGDTFLYFYPYWEAAAEALRQWRVPHWNPHLFMGAPFLANSQVGFFYPLNWLVWWLLPTPDAVKASILIHLFIAGWGAYLAARRALQLQPAAGMITAVSFALSGYLTAQVEHVNQLQGLAWLPWFLVVLAGLARDKERSRAIAAGRAAMALALLFALQLLAGHTQTTFITGIALLVWGVGQGMTAFVTRGAENALHFRFYGLRARQRAPLALLLGGGLALLLTAVQLLPTLELAQLSSRQGGLTPNEVLSFSLHPLLLARALLPAYGQSLFSEYLAFFPLTLLLLAVMGGWQWRRRRGVLPALLLVTCGLLLALGIFNPLNWLLARLPLFNFFRVPARWLILYTLGVSLLAGFGWQIGWERWQQQTQPWPELPLRVQSEFWHVERPLRTALYLLLGLMLWSALATPLAVLFPTGPEAPYEAPSGLTLLLWLIELLAAYLLLSGRRLPWPRRLAAEPSRLRSPRWLLPIGLLALFAATRTHPYNNLTTPEAYYDLRPPAARLLAAARNPLSVDSGQLSESGRVLPTNGNQHNDYRSPFTDYRSPLTSHRPPDRFLSLSHIIFEPGDQAEIDAIYVDQLDAAARFDYTVAIKQKEIIAPNLPLAYGLAAVDGFDGGILPLASYSQLMTLLLDGAETPDGRLREQLVGVPDPRWLDLFNARYLITDKTGDLWQEAGAARPFSIFFDRQHPVQIEPGEQVAVSAVPDFETTAVYVLGIGPAGPLTMLAGDGEPLEILPQPVAEALWRYELAAPAAGALPEKLTFAAADAAWTLQAVTLVNEGDESFLPVVPGQYRLVHSGDVKIYENLDALPRAFWVGEWQWQPDTDGMLAALADPAFDPAQTAVLLGAGSNGGPLPYPAAAPPPQVTTHAYEPERVVVTVNAAAPGVLVLGDAWYPGWETAVDGEPAPLLQANLLFRGVQVPAGEHEVAFSFVPESFTYGRALSALGWGIWLLLGFLLLLLRRSSAV